VDKRANETQRLSIKNKKKDKRREMELEKYLI